MTLNNIVSSTRSSPTVSMSSGTLSSTMVNLGDITHTITPGSEQSIATTTINTFPSNSIISNGSSKQLIFLNAHINVSNNFPRVTVFLKRTRDSVVNTVLATGSIDNSDPPVAVDVQGSIIGSGGNYGGTNSFSPFFCTAIDDIKIGDTFDFIFASAATTTIKVHSGTIKLMGSSVI